MDLQPPATEPDVRDLIAARPALRAHPMDGLLFEGVPLAAIARAYGTPSFVTGADTLRRRLRRLRAAMGPIAIHYAMKANDHLAVLTLLAAEGAGIDAVSGGEILRARQAGIAADRIIFSGVGKSRTELALALRESVGQINVESAEELHELSTLAAGMGATARIALRVNPDVDAGTLDQISTGRAGDKFGIPIETAADLYVLAARLPGVVPVGLAVHIGSQIFSPRSFAAAYARMADLVRTLRARGHAVAAMDCGGGLGVPYADEPDILPEAWAGAIRAAFDGLDLRLAIEPGRWLAGPAGLLLASVIRTRRAGMQRPIVILDAAMNDLPRPALYGAWHAILPVSAHDLAAAPDIVDVAGPVCESTDFLGRGRRLPVLPDGALVTILDCGAYCATMSSTYNARPAAAQLLVDHRLPPPGFACITPRQPAAALWSAEMVPGHLAT